MDDSKLGRKRKVLPVADKSKRLSEASTIFKRKRKRKRKTANVKKFIDNRLRGGKFIANKRPTGKGIKGKESHEGMFLKGLRTRYISRESLDEANEARKNEDIIKIIDIGRNRAGEGSITNRKCAEFGKASSISGTGVGLPICQSYQDFERCSPSPISFAPFLNQNQKDRKEIPKADVHSLVKKRDEIKLKNKTQMDLIKELNNFAFLYEERLCSEIIPNLPKPSVLDCALESLRQLSSPKQNEKILETHFLKKIQTLTKKHNSKTEILQETNSCFFSRREPLNMPGPFVDFPVIPEDDLVVVQTESKQFKHLQLKNNKPPSFLSLLLKKDYVQINPLFNDVKVQCENNEKQCQHSRFNTPAAPFYRRNMF